MRIPYNFRIKFNTQDIGTPSPTTKRTIVEGLGRPVKSFAELRKRDVIHRGKECISMHGLEMPLQMLTHPLHPGK